jgi:Co/Zn/Cd efflux system component
MVSFGKEARIVTLLVIDVVFFLVEIIVGEWGQERKSGAFRED